MFLMDKNINITHISGKSYFTKILSININKIKQYLRPYYENFYFMGTNYKINRNLGTVLIRIKIHQLLDNVINIKVVLNIILIYKQPEFILERALSVTSTARKSTTDQQVTW